MRALVQAVQPLVTPSASHSTHPLARAGVSGAGRAAKESNLYVEIAEGINAYGVSSHRHMPEIEQVRGLLPDQSDPANGSCRAHFLSGLWRGPRAWAGLGVGCRGMFDD